MADGPYADIQKYIRHLEQQTQDQAETIRMSSVKLCEGAFFKLNGSVMSG